MSDDVKGVKNNISESEMLGYKNKFESFQANPRLGMLKADPTLFAFYAFKDDTGKPFTAYPYQDICLNDKSDRVLLCISRQMGKSTIAAIKALHTAFFNDNFTIVVISRTKDQSVEFIRRIKQFMLNESAIPWKTIMPRAKDSKSEVYLQNMGKKTYSRIISVPATDAARGYSANMVIVDELDFWENSEYMFNQVVEPMTQATKGKIIALSTPRSKSGIFWRCFNNPFWSRYQFSWQFNLNNTSEMMEEKKYRMTALEFSAEYEAKFSASINAYFDAGDIQKCIDPHLSLGHLAGVPNIVVGVDFGKINDSAIIFIGVIENPSAPQHEQIVKVVDLRVKPLGTNYAAIVQELKEIYLTYYPNLFVMDATGVGEGPCDMLKEYGAPVEPIKFSHQKKANLFSNLKLFMEQGRIKLPNNIEMRSQLELFEYEYTIHQNILLHAPDGGHDDFVDSLSLMLWGLSRAIAPPVGLTIINSDGGMDKIKSSFRMGECRHPNRVHDEVGELFCTDCNAQL